MPFTIAVISFGASLLVCIWALPIGRALGILDAPDARRKLHGRSTPMVGGIACLAPTLVVAALLAGSADAGLLTAEGQPGLLLGMALSTAALFVLGYVDDRRDVAPGIRLGGMAVVVGLCTLSVDGMLITELRSAAGWTLALGVYGYPLTLLALVGFIVSMNMADGVNGLTPGLFATWTAALATQLDAGLQPLALALLVSLLVVLAFNLSGRLFMGDSGIYGVAGLVGFLAIHVDGLPLSGLTTVSIAAWFAVPMLDSLRVAAARIMQGRSALTPDRQHFHHLLIARYGASRAVMLYLLLVGLPVVATIAAPSPSLYWLAAECVAYGGMVVRMVTREIRSEGSTGSPG